MRNMVCQLKARPSIALIRVTGPIVRISPYELNINDSEYIDEIYVSGAKHRVNKYGWSVSLTVQYARPRTDVPGARQSQSRFTCTWEGVLCGMENSRYLPTS